MRAASEEILSIASCVKPVVFETHDEAFPYQGAGTAFLVLYNGQLFAVTAGHVVKGKNLDDLVIFPNDESSESIPFNAAFVPTELDARDPDYGDFVLVRVERSSVALTNGTAMNAIDLNSLNMNWKKVPEKYSFVVFGYPSEHRTIDYDEFKIKSNQHSMVGDLIGPAPMNHCYSLSIRRRGGVQDPDGLSGSPVIALPKRESGFNAALFCGMAIKSGKMSDFLHFVDGSVLINALNREIAKRG